MQTVVRAADAHGAMRALVDRLGPQAVLLATRRLGDGIEMVGAPQPPPADPATVAQFRDGAAALGFDPGLVDRAAEGPGADAGQLWRRLAALLERRIALAPPPHAGSEGIAVIGPPAARLALLDRLAAHLAPERPLVVAACAEDALVAVLARRHRLDLLRPDLRRGLDDVPAARRLLVDLGTASAPSHLSELIAGQARARGVVAIGVVDADAPDPSLASRADVLALLADAPRPGEALSLLALTGLPLAYLAAAPGAPLAAVRRGAIALRVEAASARRNDGIA